MIRKSPLHRKIQKLPYMWVKQWESNKDLPFNIKLWWSWKSTLIIFKN
ncbi:hypothetical protein [Tenacibaculum sp. 190524A02b]